MSVWGAYTNSIQALQAQSTALGAISQNISNLNTNGYKAADVQFQSLLSEVSGTTDTLAYGNGQLSAFSAPLDIYGVQASERNYITQSGQIESTGNWQDLAISGNGFFVTNSSSSGSGSTFYTRDGAFNTAVLPSSSTTSSTSTSSTSTSSTSGSGTGQATYLTDSAGNYLMGYAAGPTPGSLQSTLTPVNYTIDSPLASVPTTQATVTGVIPSDAPVYNPSTSTSWAPTASQSLTVYDDQGNPVSLVAQFTQTASDTWAVNFTMDSSQGNVAQPSGTISGSNEPTPATVLNYNGNGQLISQSNPAVVNITWPDGNTGSISVDLSQITQEANQGQASLSTDQNGAPPMVLSSVAFDSSGNLVGTFSPNSTLANGNFDPNTVGSVTKTLYTLPIATFASPDSLAPTNANQFVQTQGSGSSHLATINGSLSGGASLETGAVESSNVNLETQFTNMVTTQAAYNAATKVLTTADTMTQTATNLIT